METFQKRKLTHTDVEKQTKHKNRYSKSYDELRHFTKNWADLNEFLWTSRSILAENLRQLSTHVNTHELDYRRVFRGLEYFGAYFQQRVHTATQKFLRSSAHGNLSLLNFRTLELSQFLRALEDDELLIKSPHGLNQNQHLHCPRGKPVGQAIQRMVNATRRKRNVLTILTKTKNA